MFSGASSTTLHKVFTVQGDTLGTILPRQKPLCSVVQEAPNNIAQVKTLCNVVLEAPDNFAEEKILLVAFLILLG